MSFQLSGKSDKALSSKLKAISSAILGSRYELSFSFVTPAQMRKAMKYKRAPARKTSNVLAFPLSKASGEILICKAAAKPYSPAYLFIHACLHLKGRKHGATMEREERRLLERFGLLAYEQNSHRNRRRVAPR